LIDSFRRIRSGLFVRIGFEADCFDRSSLAMTVQREFVIASANEAISGEAVG